MAYNFFINNHLNKGIMMFFKKTMPEIELRFLCKEEEVKAHLLKNAEEADNNHLKINFKFITFIKVFLNSDQISSVDFSSKESLLKELESKCFQASHKEFVINFFDYLDCQLKNEQKFSPLFKELVAFLDFSLDKALIDCQEKDRSRNQSCVIS